MKNDTEHFIYAIMGVTGFFGMIIIGIVCAFKFGGVIVGCFALAFAMCMTALFLDRE